MVVFKGIVLLVLLAAGGGLGWGLGEHLFGTFGGIVGVVVGLVIAVDGFKRQIAPLQ